MLVAALVIGGAAIAQNADSVRFVTAPRINFKLPKGIEGYTVEAVPIFNSYQTISVIRYSPKRYATILSQPAPHNLTRTSEQGKAAGAVCGVNAGFWDVSIDTPSTYVRVDGKDLFAAQEFELSRVNGLLLISKHGIDVARCQPDGYAAYAAHYDNILAAGPVLIDEGRAIDYADFIKTLLHEADTPAVGYYTYARRHPRTAVGRTADGDIFLIVTDGRVKGKAHGTTIAELTQICSWLGLVEAINLDGGGSATMWCAKDGVVNHPTDNKRFDHDGERKVSSTVLVKRR